MIRQKQLSLVILSCIVPILYDATILSLFPYFPIFPLPQVIWSQSKDKQYYTAQKRDFTPSDFLFHLTKFSFNHKIMQNQQSCVDITIIIPTYNRLWSLPRAVESCRNNKCNVEIIVVDDGSNDGTWEWLQQNSDITAIRQNNWGKTWAVNKAFENAKGKYVRFLDSDDWINPDANDRQLAIAEQVEADLVVAGHDVYDESETLIRTQEWVNCDDFIAQQLGECDSSHYSAFLFRKEFIRDIVHRPDYAFRDDRCFMLEVALALPKIAIYSQPAFCHRHHHNSRLQFATGLRNTVTNFQHLSIYQKILGELDQRGELTSRRKKAAVKILWTLAHWIAHTHLDEACELARWIYPPPPPPPPIRSRFCTL